MSGKWWSRKKLNRLHPDEPFGLCMYVAWLIQCKNWDESRTNEPGVRMRFIAAFTTEKRGDKSIPRLIGCSVEAKKVYVAMECQLWIIRLSLKQIASEFLQMKRELMRGGQLTWSDFLLEFGLFTLLLKFLMPLLPFLFWKTFLDWSGPISREKSFNSARGLL